MQCHISGTLAERNNNNDNSSDNNNDNKDKNNNSNKNNKGNNSSKATTITMTTTTITMTITITITTKITTPITTTITTTTTTIQITTSTMTITTATITMTTTTITGFLLNFLLSWISLFPLFHFDRPKFILVICKITRFDLVSPGKCLHKFLHIHKLIALLIHALRHSSSAQYCEFQGNAQSWYCFKWGFW